MVIVSVIPYLMIVNVTPYLLMVINLPSIYVPIYLDVATLIPIVLLIKPVIVLMLGCNHLGT